MRNAIRTVALSALVSVAAAAKPQSLYENRIFADGVSWFRGSAKTPVTLRAAFPQAEVALELNPRVDGFGQYVVRQKGEVLFTASCGCYLHEGRWAVYQPSLYRTLDDVILKPTVVSPQYRTDAGFRVGGSLAELRQAYPSYRYDIYIVQAAPNDPYWACVFPKDWKSSSETSSIEELVFELGGAHSMKLKFGSRSGQNQFDGSLRVSAIHTSSNCAARGGWGAP